MKSVILSEDGLIKLKELIEKKVEPPYEADEFEIGAEKGGSPTYYHVVEEGWAKDHYHVDTDNLYRLEVTPEDEKPDYWEDDEDGEWVKEDDATYYVIGYDASEEEIFRADLSYDDLFDCFDEDLAEMIINHDGRQSGDGFYIDEIPYLEKIDNTNPQSVWDFLKKISDNRGPSGFILPDGECVYSYDHRGMASQVDLSLPQLLNMGAIRFTCTYGIDLSVRPTYDQICTLNSILRHSDDTIYLDICDYDGNVICSGRYEPERYQRAVNDIRNYFDEGIKPMMEGKANVNENMIDEVEPEEISLKSFKKKGELNPKLWKNDALDSRIRLKLLDVADDFWESVEVSWVKPKDYLLMGSMCNYNWSEMSDIDLHILVDFKEVDERVEFVKEYFDSKKDEWNNKHSGLKMRGYPVEFYIQDVNEPNASTGVYSLEKNEWVIEPKESDIKEIGLEKYEIKDIASKAMTMFDEIWEKISSTTDLHQLEVLGDKNDKLIKKIHDNRKKSLNDDGEMSVGNIIYKVLRRSGYVDKAHKMSDKIYDKINSITESLLKKVAKRVLNEEVVADGNAEHNPYKKRWKQEREDLKNYVISYGQLMTSMENGKQYVVLLEPEISQQIGNNYGLCVQYDPIKGEYRSVIYIRAMDKFTNQIFKPEFDTRGFDNVSGTMDDVPQQTV